MFTVETKYREIKTEIPHPTDLKWLDHLRLVESDAVPKQLPIWNKAEGFQVYDVHGNKWLDFTSGIFVANMGHSNPQVVMDLESAVWTEPLHSYSFVNYMRVQFLQKLIEITPAFAEKACLFSAGTEATEATVRVMRGWSMQQKGSHFREIVSINGAMHGTSLGARLLSGSGVIELGDELCGLLYKTLQPYGNPGIGDGSLLAGIIIESYQGWSARFYPQYFIDSLFKQAKELNVPICFDEIQGGFGRTGKMFAYEHYDVEPDLVCLGKGLTGSLPVSAVIGRAKYMDCLPEGELSSTHSGNPVGCAAGLGNLEEFSKDNFKIVGESKQKGEVLHDRLNGLKDKYPDFIVEINGKGLLAGIITKTTDQADLVCELAKQRGLLLVHTGRESIKIGPPLTIPVDALVEGVDVIDECFGELNNG